MRNIPVKNRERENVQTNDEIDGVIIVPSEDEE